MTNARFDAKAVTADNEPWWEGRKQGAPATDWQGRAYTPSNGPAAHPNSRFTVAATQNPSYAKAAEDPRGVPISALIFGGRRRELAPLVYEARTWQHGVLVAASVASETTAAATGEGSLAKRLRDSGYLTRDSRMKERKHYGFKGARRGFQFSKR